MRPNQLSPLRFVLAFGVVSMLADFVYEGARSIVGPYLATLGASAVMVGLITGFGEAVALVARLYTGRVSDRTGRHWSLSVAGYTMTIVAVPLLAISHTLWQAAGLVIAERFGKAVRTPARDTMLAQAATKHGLGFTFALHEVLDQSGALLGPLLVAGMIALSGYRLAFGILAIPGALAMIAIFWLRAKVPNPSAYEPNARSDAVTAAPRATFSKRFWLYAMFTATSMLGFSTFGVLSYHLQVKHVVGAPFIPILYAVAMGAAAIASLASGRLYDRFGLRGLFAAPILTVFIPFASFSTVPWLIWIGSLLWGSVTGIHESTMRAAIADLVPKEHRGNGYGTFAAVYGLAWLGGSTMIGALYAQSNIRIDLYVVATQFISVLIFVVLLRSKELKWQVT